MRSVNTTKFKLKTKRVRLAFAQAAVKTMMRSAQEVYDKTGQNLKGPAYGVSTSSGGLQRPNKGPGTGKMPVSRVTGDLARSLTMAPLGPATWMLWCDPYVANYAIYVHDGTKYVEARRFLGDVVDENRPIIRERIKHKLLAAIRMEGRR